MFFQFSSLDQNLQILTVNCEYFQDNASTWSMSPSVSTQVTLSVLQERAMRTPVPSDVQGTGGVWPGALEQDKRQ